ncbi:hypothetical protein J6590_013068 [Homalodisca vitripennis]|nr:hypothetical protein J6590_013068 [Homalodisca vitripennis]
MNENEMERIVSPTVLLCGAVYRLGLRLPAEHSRSGSVNLHEMLSISNQSSDVCY